MPIELNKTLVVAISATALFNLSESTKIFDEKSKSDPESAIDEYRKHMLEKEDDELEDGTGMPLVKALLNLNENLNDGDNPIVEVVIISRNSPETGFRVLKEIRRRNLPITRSAFIAGEKSSIYLDAFYVDLFLTTNEEDAQDVIDSKVCASALVKAPPKCVKPLDDKQVRFAFDADAVLFNETSEIINQTKGLKEFWSNEDENQNIPLPEEPYANLLKKLSKIQERLPGCVEYSPVKLAIMTARNSPAEMRVIKTLRAWNVYMDQAFFLGGLQKSRFLKAFKPHIFFDDQDSHLEPAALDVPCAKVLYPSHSPLNEIIRNKTDKRQIKEIKSEIVSEQLPLTNQ
ncbi:5'-nucleotidase [Francisella adeliensis]|uniref:5'-nucleotidase n=1 Tax=Francisella adeliensis TaxID=2007306 RepID=A0A2Z4Y0F6_9GAMM|nr:5'-nucleotidase [Francisella adeliensis]AXA34617.1 5'-nucleotidase [Francisella adeliensis]MBK2086343.1 5'-nucleotidase [Francisella adeliensis]MBK2096558.1 5'-nucleotidase [Francisella adeliensis]QIW12861.1 5'-nucleotidase [Francisella adeliensis]QIW14738.1 5'-nucleotidase [Francisella adeliensis]